MCGILAVINKQGGPIDEAACRRALSVLSWRGPDLDFSSKWKEQTFIGQTVLSLTGDARLHGHADTRSLSGRWSLAFNGEIYNYRKLVQRYLPDQLTVDEQTTDTAVLTNLHDVVPLVDVPDLLDGMYAYVAVDRRENALSICRDVQGEKQLYVYEDAKQLIIASEIPAILALVRGIRIDAQALRDYFHTRHLMHFERTIYHGIRQLAPGAIETFDLNQMKWVSSRRRHLSEWIDPQRLEQNRMRRVDDLADELETLIVRCVREMLPSGHAYAAVVSGGVDSSLLAYYVTREGAPVELVAVHHMGKERISSDLSGFERVLGHAIQTIRIDHTAYSAEIARCQSRLGTPLLSHSFIAQSIQSAHVRAAGCRVLFGGEGGDEYFGGYSTYLSAPAAGLRYSPSPYSTYSPTEVAFEQDVSGSVERELATAWDESRAAYAFVESQTERDTLAAMYCDGAYQLPSVGLRGGDQMSMMWSVESRSIFIRRPIVSFALNLPLAAKVDHTASSLMSTKILLKRLFLRCFPRELLFEKEGFGGFPRESSAYLGAPADFLVHDVLGIRERNNQGWNRATQWKLTNLEYFLRALPNGVAVSAGSTV
jgi:asparagine synthase (glutamine-hydrolysing)